MAALAADTVRLLKGTKTYSFKIKNAVQLYVGSFASIDSTGYLIPFAGAAQEKLVGRVLATPRSDTAGTSSLLGNTSASPVVEATVCMEGEILENVSVTGVAAITDLGSVVYLNSTDNDLTLTRPARGVPFGIVRRWYSSTNCDVQRFSASELEVIGLGGNAGESMMVMSGDYTILSSNDFTIATPPYRGKIRSISATVTKAFTTGATGSAAITMKIGGVALTGGVVTINTTGGTGGTIGDVCAGTAITAANAFSESDTLKVSVTLTSTFTAGAFMVFIVIDRKVGI